MQKIIYAIPLIFVLLTGFSTSSLSYNAFAQNYLDEVKEDIVEDLA